MVAVQLASLGVVIIIGLTVFDPQSHALEGSLGEAEIGDGLHANICSHSICHSVNRTSGLIVVELEVVLTFLHAVPADAFFNDSLGRIEVANSPALYGHVGRDGLPSFIVRARRNDGAHVRINAIEGFLREHVPFLFFVVNALEGLGVVAPRAPVSAIAICGIVSREAIAIVIIE